MPDYVMMCGIPGSGKSTWVTRNISPTNHAYCSTDALIEAYASVNNKTYNEVFQEHIKEATRQMNIHLTWAFQNNMNVVLDQTNLTKKSRVGKLSIVPKHYRKIAVVVTTPQNKEEWLRRLDRPGKIIPHNVIESMAKNYEEPTREEGFEEIIIL